MQNQSNHRQVGKANLTHGLSLAILTITSLIMFIEYELLKWAFFFRVSTCPARCSIKQYRINWSRRLAPEVPFAAFATRLVIIDCIKGRVLYCSKIGSLTSRPGKIKDSIPSQAGVRYIPAAWGRPRASVPYMKTYYRLFLQ